MKIIHYSFVLLLVMLISSCEDLFEKNISKKSVDLISPSNNLVTTSLTLTFWWEDIEGAEEYNLQVVRPTFSGVEQLVLDTNIVTAKFNYTLQQPSAYEWRVRALNNGSETSFSSIYTFRIDSTVDLSTQILTLSTPLDNYITKDTVINFKWNSLYNATNYRFQLINNTTSAIDIDTLLTATTIAFIFDEGEFTWQVRGENASSFSPYSSRTFTVALTPPTASIPDIPVKGDTVTSPVRLEWKRAAQTITDSLYIYTDSTFANKVLQYYTTDSSYIFTGIAFNNYFWRLKSMDNVGNKSGFGISSHFYVQ